MTKHTFALLTDFGFDFAVASLKGVILNSLPESRIIDLDHTIDKFNLISAAFVLNKAYRFFPKGTIFICVIDPGVGSDRNVLCVETDDYTFIAPDNGLLHYILKQENIKVWQIDNHGSPHSNTFHGRDLFVPAAIALAQGQRTFLCPSDQKACITLDQLESKQLIVYSDSFGNLKTNVSTDTITGNTVTLKTHKGTYTIPFSTTFDDVEPGELLCYRGSNDTLELAVNLGSAKALLGAQSGDEIEIYSS